jgi:hypothetical protein
VSTYRFEPGQIDAAVEQFQPAFDDVGLGEVKEAILLVDRATGRAMTVTFWEDEDAMTRSREAADRVRSGAAAAGQGSVESVEEYEVAHRQ